MKFASRARACVFARMLRQYGSEIDLVIVDASYSEKYALDLLTEMASYRKRNGPCPAALCISRVYRGPRFELEVERKGARLLYV